MDTLHLWMLLIRQKITDGSATAKALDLQPQTLERTHEVRRRRAPARGQQLDREPDPSDCHRRSNWLFAGSLRAGKRAAAVTSLIRSAKLSGHDPYAYLKDVVARLPTKRASQIGELLPHRWQAG